MWSLHQKVPSASCRYGARPAAGFHPASWPVAVAVCVHHFVQCPTRAGIVRICSHVLDNPNCVFSRLKPSRPPRVASLSSEQKLICHAWVDASITSKGADNKCKHPKKRNTSLAAQAGFRGGPLFGPPDWKPCFFVARRETSFVAAPLWL